MTSFLYIYLLNLSTWEYELVPEAELITSVVIAEDGQLALELDPEQSMLVVGDEPSGPALYSDTGLVYLYAWDFGTESYEPISTSGIYDAIVGDGSLEIVTVEGEIVLAASDEALEGPMVILAQF